MAYIAPTLHSEVRVTLYTDFTNMTIRDENITNAKAILNVDRTSATLPESSLTFSIISPTETIKNFVRGMRPGNRVNLSISRRFAGDEEHGYSATPVFDNFGLWFLKKYEITQDIIHITCMDVIGLLAANEGDITYAFHGQMSITECIYYVLGNGAPDLSGAYIMAPSSQLYDNEYPDYCMNQQLYGTVTGTTRELLRQVLQSCTMYYLPGPLYDNEPTFVPIRRKRFQSLSNLGISSIYPLLITSEQEITYFPQTEWRFTQNSVLLDDITYSHTIGSPIDIYGRVRVKYNVKTGWDGSDFTQSFTDEKTSGPYTLPYPDTDTRWENINLTVCTGRRTGYGPTEVFTPLPGTSGDDSVLDTHVYLNQIFSHHVTAEFTLISDPYNDIYKGGFLRPLSPVYVLLDQENSQYPMYVFPKTYSINISDGLKVQIDGGAIPINGPVPGWNPPTP